MAVSDGTSGSSRYTKNMLMLFGTVPVKEVESKTVESEIIIFETEGKAGDFITLCETADLG